MAKYEDQLDEMEEKVKLLQFQLKQAKQEVEDWRKIANALAHALALLDAKKPKPTWMK
jgi:chromosome segregation ATPase